jgi:hypothetical protein
MDASSIWDNVVAVAPRKMVTPLMVPTQISPFALQIMLFTFKSGNLEL